MSEQLTKELKKIEGFTPGPWRAVGRVKNHNLAMWVFGKDPDPEADRELQIISMNDSHVIKDHLKRREADMHLIAYAPELYETASALLERVKELEEGLREFLKEGKGHGCRFCDSGKLRTPNTPDKDHDDDCPYNTAKQLLTKQ